MVIDLGLRKKEIAQAKLEYLNGFYLISETEEQKNSVKCLMAEELLENDKNGLYKLKPEKKSLLLKFLFHYYKKLLGD